ncbi:flagellin [Desulfitobacterium sp. AusDCA]|uniref:flagellin N-terminal helical domain-containing protein n=1 Tax=Desulfitobacterium sp. AusDCA TaxID=3240383 RepID=UPI003DA6D2ED
MIINHNLASLNTYNRMTQNQKATESSLAKLSSGLRINSAADDAAGLAISEKMRGQIRGLDQATRNAQDGTSLLQTAEGGLNETQSILQRMRELAVQASSDTNTTSDRTALQTEMSQLTSEIDRIANTTEFNTKKLLNGDLKGVTAAVNASGATESSFANGSVALKSISKISTALKTDAIHLNVVNALSNGISTGFSKAVFSITTVLNNIAATGVKISGTNIVISAASVGGAALKIAISNATNIRSGDSITISIIAKQAANSDSTKAVHLQIGANSGQELEVGISKMDSTSLGVRATNGTALDITSQSKASGAVTLVNNAIQTVSLERSKIGAYQNRLDHTVNNLTTSSENLTSAESRIRDVDMAKEMTNYQKNSILNQASQAMLAQANQLPQGVLQLLK